MCVPLAQTALISSTTKSPLDGGLFWRFGSELCAAVIALEL